MKKPFLKKEIRERGFMLLQTLVFASIAIVMLTGLIGWAGVSVRAARHAFAREQAFQIAEAGIEYYRWHLAHAPTDYQDGTGVAGPYVHNFIDVYGVTLGQFTLTITPPYLGSTKVVVRSVGTVTGDTSATRKVEAQFAKPSIAKYAAVTNARVYYGTGDEVYGPIHSNTGVGFLDGNPDPIAHNTVTSAVTTWNDGANRFGVYTTVPGADPAPPAAVPNRPDVFQGGRQFPVPTVDFSGMTADLSALKTLAQASGFYRAGSGGSGYLVELKTNDTFDLYRVNSLLPVPNNCVNVFNQAGWGTWSVGITGGARTLLGNYAFPGNGIMVFEDHVWVEGMVNTARLTMVAAQFPVNVATYRNIIVNNNLRYTNYDGSDALGFIAQGNFLVGLASANNLRIDGAIVAQNGATFRYYYRGPTGQRCSPNHQRASLTTYGMLASFGQGYFYITSNQGNSGYLSQPASYDTNLLYAPPPSFPLLSDQYQTLYWQEVK